MVPSRRQALRSGTALLAALAGCNQLTGTATNRPPPPEGPTREERPENVAMDPPTVALRRAASRDPIVELADADENADRTERARRRTVERGFVTTREAAALLRIGDLEGRAAARQFLEETDFDEEFVFVDRQHVHQCRRLVLCYVTWTATELHRRYARIYRDYDVECSADARDRVARFVRLPGTVDAARIEPGGTFTQRGGCPVPRWRRDDTPDGGPAADESTPETESKTTAPASRRSGWKR